MKILLIDENHLLDDVPMKVLHKIKKLESKFRNYNLKKKKK